MQGKGKEQREIKNKETRKNKLRKKIMQGIEKEQREKNKRKRETKR
jgi:hypothetical protein